MYSPAEVAKNYIAIGKAKVNLSIGRMFLLGIFAGIFIAIGGLSSTIIGVSIPLASVAKFAGAVVFPGGLMMVLISGSELFTGNCLMAIPLFEKEITLMQMLKNWIVVWIGNFVGGMAVAAVVVFSHGAGQFSNALAVSMMSTAVTKVTLPFSDAFLRGIACNFIVCIAVWMSLAAKQVQGKIMAVFFPIMMFVLCGFEHSVANMYFIFAGIFGNSVPEYARAALEAGVDTSALTVGNAFTGNLIPVTFGNIIGGFVLVGCVCWYVYLKKDKKVK